MRVHSVDYTVRKREVVVGSVWYHGWKEGLHEVRRNP